MVTTFCLAPGRTGQACTGPENGALADPGLSGNFNAGSDNKNYLRKAPGSRKFSNISMNRDHFDWCAEADKG